MPFATQAPYVPLKVTDSDIELASVTFGWTIGFLYFVCYHAYRETKRARRLNGYILLIWLELVVCVVFSVICWLYLRKTIPPSFAFFFTIMTCWALQVQALLQIIVNRICILLPSERKRNQLRYGVAGVILLINITVYIIWIPAKLQISDRYVSINVWWDRCEKCAYLVVDAALNYYFITTVKSRLIQHGLKKYDALVRFNTQIVVVSLAMDVLIIGMMSLDNPFVYMQFHPVAYLVKLNIEMTMGQLIVKVATGTGVTVMEYSSQEHTSGRKPSDGQVETIGMEVRVDRQVFTEMQSDAALELEESWTTKTQPADGDIDDGYPDTKVAV